MNRARWRFFAVLIAFLLLTGFYIAERLTNQPWQRALLIAMMGLTFLLPFFRREQAVGKAAVSRQVLLVVIYVSIGMISLLLAWTLLRDVILILSLLVPGAETFALNFSDATQGARVFLIAAILTVLGAANALRGPRVRNIRIPIRDLPGSLEGFRIAQISDLHIGATIGPRYVERVVKMVEKLKPDLTALTGDIVDGSPDQLGESIALLRRLVPAGKVFYVTGNHEYYWGFARIVDAMRAVGLNVLLNQGETFAYKDRSVWVGGVTDPAAGSTEGPRVESAFSGGEKADFKLLLSHRPHLVEEAARAGFQLQLSGHTHGGQFFPWTVVIRFAHRYFLGLMKFQNTWVYVNPGTGSWGPPLRLGTTPELTHIHLVREVGS